MPLATIYITQKEHEEKIKTHVDSIRSFLAGQLSCGERTLRDEEISIQVIAPMASRAIAPVEMVIVAHQYAQRVNRQDEICRNMKNHLKDECGVDDSYVWLQLCELGHSA